MSDYAPPPESTNGTGPESRRSYNVDPRTATGTWHLARGKYGRRPGDRPVWWVLLYHFAKGAAGLLPYVAAAWIAKWLGLDLGALARLLIPGGP